VTKVESKASSSQEAPSPVRKRGEAFSRWQVIASILCAIGVAVATRWPAAAILAGAGALGIPPLLRANGGKRELETLEAIAVWTEMLRDILAGAAGLGQAIAATAPIAPEAIREPVQQLASALETGTAPERALRAFANELNDPTSDRVVAALMMANRFHAQRLGDLLGALADSTREEVAMRLRIEVSRASTRSSIRTVTLFSVAFTLGLFLLAHSYLSPYGTSAGQVVLLCVGGCYAGGLVLMTWIARPPAQLRLLGGPEVHDSDDTRLARSPR